MVTAALGRWRKIAALSDVRVQVSLAHISKADWVDGEKGCQRKYLANASRGKPTIWFPRESMWGFGKGDLEVWAGSVLLKELPKPTWVQKATN